MNKAELTEILEKHRKWLMSEVGGERADLRFSDLCFADLRFSDLSFADLSGADLRNADLRNADLRKADLRKTDLRKTDLRNADLSGADLRFADLSNAYLYGADLSNAKIDEKIVKKFYPLCCPEVGEFIGWKKVADDYIVKLRITEDAKRSSAYKRKCRCSKAEVLAIENIDGSKADVDIAYSDYDESFAYKVGETVEPKMPFNEDRFNECASGIHFFITRQEAVDYVL